MIDDKVKIKCSKCSMMFRERAQRIRNGFQKQCPHCLKLITFDTSSDDNNIRRALKSARENFVRRSRMLRQPPTSPDGNQIPTGHNATAHAGVLAVLLSDSRKARDDLSQSKSKAVAARSGTDF